MGKGLIVRLEFELLKIYFLYTKEQQLNWFY